MHKFSDFADININVGEKIKIDDVLEETIQVISYTISESKYKKSNCDRCLTLQTKHNGEDRIVFTGSNVLINQIETYADKLPFETKIIKNERFYTFS